MRRCGAVLAAAVLATAGPPAAASRVVPDCSMMVATPAGSPLVVWCATTAHSATTGRTVGVRLWRSSGDGRWVEAAAANVVTDAVPAPPQVSPRWATDRTLYWATPAGLFASTDLGDTFRLVSSLVTGTGHPIRRVLLSDTGTAVTAAVAGSDPHDVGFVLSGDTTLPALGSREEDLMFVTAPGGPAALAWDSPTTTPHRVVAYRCTALYACGEPWFSLPVPSDGWAQQLAGAWRPPSGSEEPTYLAVRGGNQFAQMRLWSATQAPAALPAADAAIAALTDGRNAPLVTLAFRGSLVVMRVISWADRKGASHDVVLTSADRGRSWRRAVGATTTRTARSSGPAGWRPGAVSLSFQPALVVRGDVWLVNASDGVRYTLRCSVDGGRRWRSSCG